MDTIDPKPKRKNEESRSRRAMFIAGIALVVLTAVGMIVFQSRFTPMSDVPSHNLVYMEVGKLYELDFQTGQRSLTTYPPKPSWSYPYQGSPDSHWVISSEWRYAEKSSLLILRDFTGQLPSRTLGSFDMIHGSMNPLNWSPDEQWVVFAADPPGSNASLQSDNLENSEVWMAHIPTGEMTRLTNNSYRDSDPVFSPDGTQIAYISAQSGTPNIYLRDTSTGEERRLTPVSPTHAQTLHWSPDGQWIAYNATQRVDINPTDYVLEISLYVIRVDGAHVQKVAGGDTHSFFIGWKS